MLLVQTLPAKDRPPVVAQDPAAVIAALGSLTAHGATAFYDSVLEAERALSEQTEKRKAIVAFTDGRDTVSSGTVKQCCEGAQAAGIPIYCLGLGRTATDPLRALAQTSGGDAAWGASPKELRDWYRTIAGRLARRYRIRYQAAAPRQGEVWRLVQVALAGDREAQRRPTVPLAKRRRGRVYRWGVLAPARGAGGDAGG